MSPEAKPRRFPPPWYVEERGESFIVHDATGQALGYFYFEDEPSRRRKPTAGPRRFPPPWSVEELSTSFVVRDDNGQKLAYVHFEEEPGRRSAANLLQRNLTKTFIWCRVP